MQQAGPKDKNTGTGIMNFISLWALVRLATLISGVVIGFLALTSLARAETIVHKSTSYFTIHGKSAADLDRGLAHSGPVAGGEQSRHPGAAQIRFAGDLGYKEAPGRCAVASARIKLTLKIILPSWAERRTATPSLGILWDTLASDIKRHEERHAEIAVQHAHAMEKALLALPPQPTCAQMRALANRTTDQQIALHDADQQRFDRVEMANFESRMTRLIQYRTMQASAAH